MSMQRQRPNGLRSRYVSMVAVLTLAAAIPGTAAAADESPEYRRFSGTAHWFTYSYIEGQLEIEARIRFYEGHLDVPGAKGKGLAGEWLRGSVLASDCVNDVTVVWELPALLNVDDVEWAHDPRQEGGPLEFWDGTTISLPGLTLTGTKSFFVGCSGSTVMASPPIATEGTLSFEATMTKPKGKKQPGGWTSPDGLQISVGADFTTPAWTSVEFMTFKSRTHIPIWP